MSGGSMDYVCYEVENAARMTNDPEFAEMLRDAAKVLHDEEWWRSADSSKQQYLDELARFKAKWFKGDRTQRLKGYVDERIKWAIEDCYSLIGVVDNAD